MSEPPFSFYPPSVQTHQEKSLHASPSDFLWKSPPLRTNSDGNGEDFLDIDSVVRSSEDLTQQLKQGLPREKAIDMTEVADKLVASINSVDSLLRKRSSAEAYTLTMPPSFTVPHPKPEATRLDNPYQDLSSITVPPSPYMMNSGNGSVGTNTFESPFAGIYQIPTSFNVPSNSCFNNQRLMNSLPDFFSLYSPFVPTPTSQSILGIDTRFNQCQNLAVEETKLPRRIEPKMKPRRGEVLKALQFYILKRIDQATGKEKETLTQLLMFLVTNPQIHCRDVTWKAIFAALKKASKELQDAHFSLLKSLLDDADLFQKCLALTSADEHAKTLHCDGKNRTKFIKDYESNRRKLSDA